MRLAGFRYALASLVAVSALSVPAFLAPSPTPDWPAWVAGAHLAGDAARLYSFEESQRITKDFAEPRDGVWAFVRPPVYATFLRPLAWLTPREAFVVWQAINLAALMIAALLIWPSPWAPILAALFPPLLQSFRQGQDMPLFLLATAVALRTLPHRPILAGAALSLLGLKPHLILLLPVLFVMHRTLRLAGGFFAGGAVLIAGCFALYGWAWPRLYIDFVLENQLHLGIPAADGSRLILLFGVACALAFLVRRLRNAETALLAALALGVLAAPRMYAYDFALALPLLLVLVRSASAGAPSSVAGDGAQANASPDRVLSHPDS